MKPTVVVIVLAVLAAAVLLGCKAQPAPAPETDAPKAPGKPADGSAKTSLSFHSFDGGGPSFRALPEDASLLDWAQTRDYGKRNHEELEGASYTETFTFTGKQPGSTRLTIEERSPIAGNYDHVYAVTVGDDLRVTLELLETRDIDAQAFEPTPTLVLAADDKYLYASLADGPAAEALAEKLSEGPIAVELRDCGFGKTGSLPWALPGQAASVTAQPGELLLSQGDQLTLCCGETEGDFLRLAEIGGTSAEELLAALGSGDVTLTLWLEWSE